MIFNYLNISFSINFSEVVLGEHNVVTNPDCQKMNDGGGKMCAPPKITRTVSKVIVHEKYKGSANGN